MENNAMEIILQKLNNISERLHRIEDNNAVSDNITGQRAGDTAYVDRNTLRVDSDTLRQNRRTSFYNRDRESGQHDPTLENDNFHFDRPHDHRFISPPITSRPTTIIQSVVALDARTSGIQLTTTSFPAVFKFEKSLKKEQEHSEFQNIKYSSYISEDVRNYMEAYNREKQILSESTTSVLSSGRFVMSNAEVMHLLMKIALPKSPEEFVSCLKSSIPSKVLQLPANYQVQANHWQPIYKMILTYVKEFMDILGLLQSDFNQDYSPPLFSKPPAQNPGLIQIFYLQLPSNIGLNIHKQLNQEQVKLLTNFKDYVSMFQLVSAKYNDMSIAFAINNKRFDTLAPLNSSGEFNQVKTGGNNTFHSNNNNNNNNRYNNPYIKPVNSANNLFNLRNNTYNGADYNYNARLTRYNNTRDDIFDEQIISNNIDDIHDFNYADNSDYISDEIIHHANNPAYSQHPPDVVLSNDCVYAFVSSNNGAKTSTLPCFSAVRGTCKEGSSCKFSHDPYTLRMEFHKQWNALQQSPLNRNTPGKSPLVPNSTPVSTNIPGRSQPPPHLRALTVSYKTPQEQKSLPFTQPSIQKELYALTGGKSIDVSPTFNIPHVYTAPLSDPYDITRLQNDTPHHSEDNTHIV
jgi:hypothetical protein